MGLIFLVGDVNSNYYKHILKSSIITLESDIYIYIYISRGSPNLRVKLVVKSPNT